jgi:CRISPR-associated protein Cmr1
MPQIKVKTLTPLWTGDVNGECSMIKETSIIGSLRWWYEALVRGLGGYACDPASRNEDKKCRLDYDKFKVAMVSGESTQQALDEQICPACQLFGCTSWSRGFRLEVRECDMGRFDSWGLRENSCFVLNITETRSITEEQKWLFRKTLDIVEKYGAIGGRTTRKPQESKLGMPYGLVKLECSQIEAWDHNRKTEDVRSWLCLNKRKLKKKNNEGWFDLRWYWKASGVYLDRVKMNEFLKLEEIYVGGKKRIRPKEGTERNEFLRFLRGSIGESKKIFSFGNVHVKIEPMIFGYVRNREEIEKIRKMITKELGEVEVTIGEDILRKMSENNNESLHEGCQAERKKGETFSSSVNGDSHGIIQ